MDVRLARILLPAKLLREVDELIVEGLGGYSTRQEFFVDAIENHLLEVKYGPSEDEGRRVPAPPRSAPWTSGRPTSRPVTACTEELGDEVAENGQPATLGELGTGVPVEPLQDFVKTAIKAPDRGPTVTEGIGHFKPEAMFGLHNRDYPTLWAAVRLAEMTSEQLISGEAFLGRVTELAWDFASSLAELEERSGAKLTALFPTNRTKPQSAEAGFRAFAVGTIARKPSDGGVDVAGPFFEWQIAQLTRVDRELLLGLTEAGYRLLQALDGLTLEQPHSPELANRFFTYLREHAPWDWAGFERLLVELAEQPTRVELIERFRAWQPDWSEVKCSTNAAGYVARAREWGLVEPKLQDHRYLLTEFGEQMLAGVAA